MTTRPATLLIVDDDESNRDMLSRRLKTRGYEVATAPDGPSAVHFIEQQRVDLVLLDIAMPGMSGLEVLEHLRRTYSVADLPIIMVTARTQSEDLVEAIENGANDYVTKPIDFPVLVARVGAQVARKRAEEALKVSEERYSLAIRGANDGVWDWDLQTNELFLSPRWKSMVGYREDEVGNTPDDWFRLIAPPDLPAVRSALHDHLEGRTPHLECDYRMRHKDDTYRWMLTRGLAVRNEAGKATRIAGSQTDVTDSRVVDALTGLPNRVLLLDRLGRLFERLKRHPSQLFAVLFIDLDRFKLVNDTLGHGTGDRLLVAFARRLERHLRSTDTVTRATLMPRSLARLGGDEFTVLIEDVQSLEVAETIAARIHGALREPFVLDDHHLVVTVSIGIAMVNSSYQGPEELLRDADVAMYEAKRQGRAKSQSFDDSMRARAAEQMEIEVELRAALELKHFHGLHRFEYKD